MREISIRPRVTAPRLAVVMIGLFILGWIHMAIDWSVVGNGFGRLGHFVDVMWPPRYGSNATLLAYLSALGETVAIAFLGTVLGAGLAFPLSFFAVRVVTPFGAVRFVARRFFEMVRCVDPLIYALIWIGVVGLGPFAGVLAIMTAELGIFGKLFSDELEASGARDVQAVRASGASRLLVIRFGLLPQALPVMLGNLLYQFESNVRSATIIGVVGAGGVGGHFFELIKENDWQAVCFLTLIVLVTVALTDSLSAWLCRAGNLRS